MRTIAIVLLLGVFLAHDAANWLSGHSRFTPPAVFYMLQGAWSVVLSSVLLMLFWMATASIWRTLCIAAMVISIVEGLQVAVCRLAVDDIGSVPQGMNLCDYVTGIPVGTITTILYLVILAWLIGGWLIGDEE